MMNNVVVFLSYISLIVGIFFGMRSMTNKAKDIEYNWFGFSKLSYKATFTEKGWKYHKLAILFGAIAFLLMFLDGYL